MRVIALPISFLALTVLSVFQPLQCSAQTQRTTTKPMKSETPHLQFVNEYVRELVEIERIRAAGEDEANQDKKDGKLPFAGLIHTSTMMELELGSQVRALKGMQLTSPF